MNKQPPVIVFSNRAKQRFEQLTEYLYQQHLSKQFVNNYINQFECWLQLVLGACRTKPIEAKKSLV
jgi:hypothetical protein